MSEWIEVTGWQREPIEVNVGDPRYGPVSPWRQFTPGPLFLVLADGSRIDWNPADGVPKRVRLSDDGESWVSEQ